MRASARATGSRSTSSASTASPRRRATRSGSIPLRAAEGPFGTTVAHGFLTPSSLSPLFDDLVVFDDSALSINYGLDRVRFPAPVPVGSRIRATFEVESVGQIEGGIQVTFGARVEREGSEKPVCVATMIFRFLR